MKRETERIEKMCGGTGSTLIERLVGPEAGEKCRLFARVILKPLCSVGYHEHHGECETYYVLCGKGVYDDNGTERSVKAGDVMVCPSGQGHAIRNTELENLEFIALILAD